MEPEQTPMAALHRLANEQHGVVALADLRRLGVTTAQLRTALRSHAWTSPHRGVYVSVAAPSTWKQRCMIAASSTGGVVSHLAAVRLHALDGAGRAEVEITVLRGARPRPAGVVVHRAAMLDPADVTVVDGVRVTSIARTLVDLGAVADDDLVEQVLDDSLRRGCSLRWIVATLDRLERPGPNGSGSLRRVLARPDRRGPLPDSMFERLVERAIATTDLPRPDRQVPVHDEVGRRIARIDVAWPDVRLGLEAHSAEWHDRARRGRADLRRHRRLTGLGWEVVDATWWDAQHPEDFLRDLTSTYRLRSAAAPPPPT